MYILNTRKTLTFWDGSLQHAYCQGRSAFGLQISADENCPSQKEEKLKYNYFLVTCHKLLKVYDLNYIWINKAQGG